MDEFTKRHFGFTVVAINDMLNMIMNQNNQSKESLIKDFKDIENMVKRCKELALSELKET